MAWTTNLMFEGIQGFNLLGSDIILPLVISFVVMLIITRDFNKWAYLFFPTSILLFIMGLRVHLMILLISSIVFVISVISMAREGNVIIPNVISKEEQRESYGLRKKERTVALRGLDSDALREMLDKRKLSYRVRTTAKGVSDKFREWFG